MNLLRVTVSVLKLSHIESVSNLLQEMCLNALGIQKFVQ